MDLHPIQGGGGRNTLSNFMPQRLGYKLLFDRPLGL